MSVGPIRCPPGKTRLTYWRRSPSATAGFSRWLSCCYWLVGIVVIEMVVVGMAVAVVLVMVVMVVVVMVVFS